MSVNKKTGIVIGIAIVVFVIIFGIISLPDEILIEPPSVDRSEIQTGEEKKVIIPSESISTTEQSESEDADPVEQSDSEDADPVEQSDSEDADPVEQSDSEDADPVEQSESEVGSQENVIEVKIKDGIGTGDK